MSSMRHPASPGIPSGDEGALRGEFLRLKGALWDTNTGLPGAPAMLETVRAFFQKGTSAGVVHMEIDPLARVETVYGWQVVDRLLRAVAEELETMRGDGLPPGSLICQAGICADRFLVFVPLGRSEASGRPSVLPAVSRACQERMARRFGGEEFRTMAPRPALLVGTSVLTEHPFYRLERQIYRAIDEAREAGQRSAPKEQSRQQAEIKRIIRDQRIEIWFQPVMDLERSRIVGYEALTRGPRDTIFESPGTLFECSREVGMAAELDLLCQRAALQQARRLRAGDKLFLNALPLSLLDPGFREGLLAEMPGDFPVARHDIVLEIAEGVAWDDYEGFGSEVSDLRSRGFQMSIDDVGRAPSSLEHLSQVRPDYIKVDPSLIRNIDRNMIKQEMLRSLCHAAGGIGATIVAEGIETGGELAAVRECGARYGQGYFFYRPSRDLPAREAQAGRQDA